jgi:hypothetical protein
MDHKTTSDLVSQGSESSIQMVEPLQAELQFMVVSNEPHARVISVTGFGRGSDAMSLQWPYDLIIHDSTQCSILVLHFNNILVTILEFLYTW